MSHSSEDVAVERHPLEPFAPVHARLLMLGSFPPPQKRWSMYFFYPNLQNDMWRIFGTLFFGDKDYFVIKEEKRFDKDKLVDFLTAKGVALYDTATAVKRLLGNASDAALEVVEPTDVFALLRQLPECQAVVTTGQKATDTLVALLKVKQPPIGESVPFEFEGRAMRLYRMPSSSRAYPMKLEKKAAVYGSMLQDLGLLES